MQIVYLWLRDGHRMLCYEERRCRRARPCAVVVVASDVVDQVAITDDRPSSRPRLQPGDPNADQFDARTGCVTFCTSADAPGARTGGVLSDDGSGSAEQKIGFRIVSSSPVAWRP